MASSILQSNQELTVGQQIATSNGKGYLVMQGDGNLVLYRNGTTAQPSPQALWASGTNGQPVTYAILQSDGNFVCYTAGGAAPWSSQTNGNPGAYLALEDDGNLVIYSAANVALWATNTAQWDFTPSTAAANAIQSVAITAAPGATYFMTTKAPGWTYKLRFNGTEYADAPFGWAQVPGSGAGLAMTNDTIIHVASMSKPVCVTSFVALLDDWTELENGFLGSGPLAGSIEMTLSPFPIGALPPLQQPLIPPPVPIPGRSVVLQVPQWLAPALTSGSTALEQLIQAGLLSAVPSNLAYAVSELALRKATIRPVVQGPPGYVGLLSKVIERTPVPQYTDPFWSLISSRLQSKAQSLNIPIVEGQGVGGVTIAELITHSSTLRNGFTDSSVLTLIPSANTFQPTNGQHVTCDIWAYLLAFLHQPADGSSGYKNDDYNVLGGIVEACSGMDYDDYVTDRLFSDPRFVDLRRYVTAPAISADYYEGLGPFLTSGNPFPDYRGWGGSGGFYYTANQITDWLYALYSRESVERISWSGPSSPLVSQSGFEQLFDTTAFFTAGKYNTVNGVPQWTTYTHNGGTGVGTGSCGGNLGIVVSNSGDVMTGFFCANGSLEGTEPFNSALIAVLTNP